MDFSTIDEINMKSMVMNKYDILIFLILLIKIIGLTDDGICMGWVWWFGGWGYLP